MDENQENNEKIIPDAGIVKCLDGKYCIVKFVIETNEDTMGEELVAYTTEISAEDLSNVEAVDELDEYSILFVKINYEFQFDEDSGVMEMNLSRIVTLTDAETNNLVIAQEVIEKAPEDLVPVYLNLIQSL